MIHEHVIYAAATLTVASITKWISDEDWNRLVGPWGGFVVSILLCAILLRHSAKRIKREDERAITDAQERERRHKEAMEAQAAVAGKFETLSNRQMDTQLETAKALLKLSHSCENLHMEMRSRPCQRTSNCNDPNE